MDARPPRERPFPGRFRTVLVARFVYVKLQPALKRLTRPSGRQPYSHVLENSRIVACLFLFSQENKNWSFHPGTWYTVTFPSSVNAANSSRRRVGVRAIRPGP